MADIINNLTLFVLWGCVFISVATVCYSVGVIKYVKRYMILNEKLEKIKINDISNKENI